jgi:hypothetical protein
MSEAKPTKAELQEMERAGKKVAELFGTMSNKRVREVQDYFGKTIEGIMGCGDGDVLIAHLLEPSKSLEEWDETPKSEVNPIVEAFLND